MNFTKEQKSILIGTILGDAYLQKTGKKNSRLRLEHGKKQKEYLLWKVSKFPCLFQGKSKYVKRQHPLSQKIYEYWRHQSSSTPELGKWRKIFYQNDKKCIPDNLETILEDPLSLAVWYMDDGYYYDRDKISCLYLGRIEKKQAQIVQRVLMKNFRIISRVVDKKRKGFVIYFSPEETLKLHRKIDKFVLPLFHYKLRVVNPFDPVTTDPYMGES